MARSTYSCHSLLSPVMTYLFKVMPGYVRTGNWMHVQARKNDSSRWLVDWLATFHYESLTHLQHATTIWPAYRAARDTN